MTTYTSTDVNNFFVNDNLTIQQCYNKYLQNSPTTDTLLVFMGGIPSSYGSTAIDELYKLNNNNSKLFSDYYSIISYNNSTYAVTSYYRLGSIYNILQNYPLPILRYVDVNSSNITDSNFNNSLLMLYGSSIYYYMNFSYLPDSSSLLSSYLPSNVLPINSISNLSTLLTYAQTLSSNITNIYYYQNILYNTLKSSSYVAPTSTNFSNTSLYYTDIYTAFTQTYNNLYSTIYLVYSSYTILNNFITTINTNGSIILYTNTKQYTEYNSGVSGYYPSGNYPNGSFISISPAPTSTFLTSSTTTINGITKSITISSSENQYVDVNTYTNIDDQLKVTTTPTQTTIYSYTTTNSINSINDLSTFYLTTNNQSFISSIYTYSNNIYTNISDIVQIISYDITNITTYYNNYHNDYTSYSTNLSPSTLVSFFKDIYYFLYYVMLFSKSIANSNLYSNSAFIVNNYTTNSYTVNLGTSSPDQVTANYNNLTLNYSILLLAHQCVQNLVQPTILTLSNYYTISLSPDFLLLTTPVSGENWSKTDIITVYGSSAIDTIITNVYNENTSNINKDLSVSSSDYLISSINIVLNNQKSINGLLLTLVEIGATKSDIFNNVNFISSVRNDTNINSSTISTALSSYSTFVNLINNNVIDSTINSTNILFIANYSDRFSLFNIWTSSYPISIYYPLCIFRSYENTWDLYEGIINNYVSKGGFINDLTYSDAGLLSETNASNDIKTLYYFVNFINLNYNTIINSIFYTDKTTTNINMSAVSLGISLNSNFVNIVANAYTTNNLTLNETYDIPDYRTDSLTASANSTNPGWGNLYNSLYSYTEIGLISSITDGMNIIISIDKKLFGVQYVNYGISVLPDYTTYGANYLDLGTTSNIDYSNYIGNSLSSILNSTSNSNEYYGYDGSVSVSYYLTDNYFRYIVYSTNI